MSSTRDFPALPYAPGDLARIINTLSVKGLSKLSPNDVALAIEQANDEIRSQPPCWLYFITGLLQGIALEYLRDRAFEHGTRFKDARKVLRHIAGADLEALPASIRDQLIPWRQFNPLRSTLRHLRQNAASLLKSLPERGALPQKARFILVDQLADLYEKAIGRRANKVGKDSNYKGGPRKRSGCFRSFVLAALEPLKRIDPSVCAGIDDVIDAVIDKRRGKPKKQRAAKSSTVPIRQ